jgi:muramoyltetrapeptide carboxypeptidase
MDAVYLWCPAYALPAERLAPARAAGATFAHGIGSPLVEADDLAVTIGPGAWRAADERRGSFRVGLDHAVLLAARGGYGCLDLLETVQAHHDQLPYLIGYSDLTVLHAAWRIRGTESLYGFMPGVPHGERALGSAIQAWRGDGLRWDPATCPEVVPTGMGDASGTLFAGCLRVLAGLVGTPWMPSLRGCLLALEDIDERPYRIDRDLTQLHLAGCLEGVTGLVTNAFPTALPEDYAGPSAVEVVRAWAGRLGIPAITCLPFGHHADPLALPCGRKATLSVAPTAWSLVVAPR